VFDSGEAGGVVLDRMFAHARLLSQVQALLLADAVEVADLTPNPEFAAFEVSSLLAWTTRASATHLELAYHVVLRLPDVHAAMLAGDLDLPKARIIVDRLETLPLPLARKIAAAILPKASRLTTGELGPRLARMIIKADPEAAARRRKARQRKRRVEFEPTQDSCANLLGVDLPAEDALAASNRLTELARALKQAGDPRSMDQLRADTFLNLLLGKTCGHPSAAGPHGRGEASPGGTYGPTGTPGPHGCCCGDAANRHRAGGVELTGSLEMLARLSNEPGDLAGYGAVIADIARQVAEQQRNAPWTFTIRDEATGRVYTAATRRRPTAAMTREIRVRDRTCRAPGCRRIGIYADIDHTIAYEHGGLTVPGNLGLLCRYHHRAKHEGFWLLIQIRPGVFIWRSPLGRRYIVYPAAP
jgi:hypothetical protein